MMWQWLTIHAVWVFLAAAIALVATYLIRALLRRRTRKVTARQLAGTGQVVGIAAFWAFGTAGTGSQTVSLVGMVVDFSEYYASNGFADIAFYTHHYGTFGPGDELAGASLLLTGAPE